MRTVQEAPRYSKNRNKSKNCQNDPRTSGLRTPSATHVLRRHRYKRKGSQEDEIADKS